MTPKSTPAAPARQELLSNLRLPASPAADTTQSSDPTAAPAVSLEGFGEAPAPAATAKSEAAMLQLQAVPELDSATFRDMKIRLESLEPKFPAHPEDHIVTLAVSPENAPRTIIKLTTSEPERFFNEVLFVLRGIRAKPGEGTVAMIMLGYNPDAIRKKKERLQQLLDERQRLDAQLTALIAAEGEQSPGIKALRATLADLDQEILKQQSSAGVKAAEPDSKPPR